MKYLLGLVALAVISSSAPEAALAQSDNRVDVSASNSALSGGMSDWREASIALSRRFAEGWSGVVKLEDQVRFGEHDVYSELRVDRVMNRVAFYLAAGGAADADFRPKAAFKAGAFFDIAPQPGATILFLDTDASRLASGDVYAVKVGVDQQLNADDWRASLQAVSVSERGGPALLGFVVQSQLPLSRNLSARVGYADAPETSEGVVVRVRGWTAGLRFDINDDWLVRTDVTREDRGRYTRSEISAGAALRF